MSEWMREQLEAHIQVAQQGEQLLPALREVGKVLCDAFAERGILYTFGNGGSAADAQHFTGEIIGHYKRDRRPLGAVTLSTDPTTMTCIAESTTRTTTSSRARCSASRGRATWSAAFTTSGRSAEHRLGARSGEVRGGDDRAVRRG
ncbi:SIS domain-containing protein [Leifsonia sp. L25]|uniref:SIS domain-containing protein n=1 Tax=Leifsonia sp. L25 TaxID=3423957 RepID=UPI003D680BA8